jgi:hypothetical protein
MQILPQRRTIRLHRGIVRLRAGCATVPRTPRVSEDLLVTAGFKIVAARTDAQQQHLQTLQQGAVSEMQQTGKHFYVYPDLANRRLYVGTPKEYESYLALRTRQWIAQPRRGGRRERRPAAVPQTRRGDGESRRAEGGGIFLDGLARFRVLFSIR